jgi:hypothetical protein
MSEENKEVKGEIEDAIDTPEETQSISKDHEIAVSNKNSAISNSDRFNSSLLSKLEQDETLATIELLSKNSNQLKIGNKVDAFAIALNAKALNLPLITALQHCHFVNGKVGIDVHIIKSILLQSGIIKWEIVKDFAPIYTYTDGAIAISGNELSESHKITSKLNSPHADKIREEGYLPVVVVPNKDATPVVEDRITIYKFTRLLKGKDKFSEIVEFGEFRYSDAKRASLIKSKSAWENYPRVMMSHRAFTLGARSIGGDLLLGMYTYDEVLDMADEVYTLDENNNVIKMNQ